MAADVLSAGGAEAEPSATALRGIAEDLAPFFELVHQQAECFEPLYEEALREREGELRREDLDALNPEIHAALRRFGDSIVGTGVVPARVCRPHLDPLGRRVALVNRFGRVVASTNHLWATPGHSLETHLVEWCMQCNGPVVRATERPDPRPPGGAPLGLVVVD